VNSKELIAAIKGVLLSMGGMMFEVTLDEIFIEGDEYYQNQYGHPHATLKEFYEFYKGKTENEIVFGESSFLGYKYPNDIDKRFRFLSLVNGKEVDMIHFMVVRRRGYWMGISNEFKQLLTFSSSAFYPQDLYSNQLGLTFFFYYDSAILKHPIRIAEYILVSI
jgi:hypothetical protein